MRTAKRVQKVLARHGRLLDDATVDTGPKGEQLALAALVGAAASGLGLTVSVLTSSEGRMVEKIEGPTSERQVVRRWTRDHSVHGEAVPLDLVA